MKILQISPYPPSYLGGSEIFCKNLSINLKKFHDIDSVILTSDIFRKNLKTDIIDGPVKVVYKKFYLNLLGKNPIVNVFNYIKKHYREFDIIHAHSYIFFTSFQASMLRKMLKFPLVLHIHGGAQTFSMLKSSLIERIQLLSKQYIFDKFIGKFIIEGSDAII
ncbi:MAG: glycosyltransferase, partial [Promethearchaeia archaeon]